MIRLSSIFDHGVILRVELDRKSTRLNSSHANISYAVFCLKKTTTEHRRAQPFGKTPPSSHGAETRGGATSLVPDCAGGWRVGPFNPPLYFFFFFLKNTAPPGFSPFPPPAVLRP